MANGYAVLVGVNTYTDDISHPRLEYAVSDAISVYAFVTHPRFTGLPRDHVRLLLTGTDGQLREEAERVKATLALKYNLELPEHFAEDVVSRRRQPTIVQTMTAVRQAASDARGDDLLLVYFSGHGHLLNGIPLLLALDAHPDAYLHSAVRLDDLEAVLRGSEARAKVVLFDACEAGAGASGIEGNDVVFFSSSLENQPSLEVNEGVFTKFLLDGLSGDADGNGLGRVTLHDLAEFTTRGVVQWITTNIPYTRRQTPCLNEAGKRLGRRIVLSGSLPARELDYQDDIFVSYAAEDRHAVVPLVERLIGDGYFVWFDDRHPRPVSSVDSARHVLLCLSEAYGQSDPTLSELTRVLSSIGRERVFPVVVRPLSGPVSPDLRPFLVSGRSFDLGDASSSELEYHRLTQSIAKGARGPLLPLRAEIADVATFVDPGSVVARLATYSQQIFVYLWKRSLPGVPPTPTADLAAGLISRHDLPAPVKNHIRTLRYAVELINHVSTLRRSELDSSVQTLKELFDWVVQTYGTSPAAVSANPFEELWRELLTKTGRAQIPQAWYELIQRDAAVSAVGSIYPGRNVKDESGVDVVLAPVSPAGQAAFDVMAEECRVLPPVAPIAVEACGQFELPDSGRWGYVALQRAEGVAVRALIRRFHPLPPALALALARHVVGAYSALQRYPALACALFEASSVVVDRSGFVRLKRDWTAQGGGISPGTRDQFWFAGTAGVSPVAVGVQSALAEILNDVLDGSHPDIVAARSASAKATSLADLGPALQSPSPSQMTDQDLVKTAIECYVEGRDLPPWISTPLAPAQGGPPAGSALSPIPTANGRTSPTVASGARALELVRTGSVNVEAVAAWPLGVDWVLVSGTDGRLRIHEWSSGSLAWSDDRPVRVRCWKRGVQDALALGGWEGDVRWFDQGVQRGCDSLAWTVASIQPFGQAWIAGSWNGQLKVLGADRSRELLAVDQGVFKIAVGPASVAVLGTWGAVAEYDTAGTRIRQSGPIDRAVDIAFADGAVVVLTEDGRLWTIDGKPGRRPDRLPARERVRLVARNGACVLANDQGYTWRIDRAGTYPPDVRLPNRHVVDASPDLHRCITLAGGALAYWRRGHKLKVWHDATHAVLSPAGTAVVVTLPDRIELWQDREQVS